MTREREACIRLALVDGIGPSAFRTLLNQAGSAAAILDLDDEALGSKGDRVRRARDMDLSALNLEQVVTLADSDYSELLREIHDPPLALWYRGQRPAGVPRAAVVGTRRATAYGRRMAADIARDLSDAGVEVVSGLALGIDGAAHRGALEGAGTTVAVLGSGIDHVFPAVHRDLARRIEACGTVMTEFPPGMRAFKGNFPRRNRIIAGLCRAVIVVEAGARGGALITAQLGLQENRDLYAVPGDVGRPSSLGTNRLIRDAAAGLILEARDVLEGTWPALGSLPPAEPAANTPVAAPVSGLIAHLAPEPRSVDELCAACGMDVPVALAELMRLELAGRVRQYPGKQFGLA